MEVSQKTKNRVAMRSSNPTPGHIPRKNCTAKRYREFSAVQWLGLFASTTGSKGLILGQGTKILHGSWHGQKAIEKI